VLDELVAHVPVRGRLGLLLVESQVQEGDGDTLVVLHLALRPVTPAIGFRMGRSGTRGGECGRGRRAESRNNGGAARNRVLHGHLPR
jgi:hypothetical protein